jgi:hypothetical protein
MILADFVKLPAKEASDMLRQARKEEKIDWKTFKDWSAAWLEGQGYIYTNIGWFKQGELDGMGMIKDGDEWIVGTQEKMVTYKDSFGKYHDKFVSVPTKMVEWEERHKTVQGVYEDAKERKLSADEMEKLLLEGLE